MTRFLILSFAVLGWAFWELSGGADFEPPARPERIAEAAEPAPGNAPATPDLARREVAAERRVAPEPENTPPRAAVQSARAEAPPAQTPRLTAGLGQPSLPPADPNNPGMLVSLEQSRTQFATPLEHFDPDAIPEDEPAPTPEPVAAPAAPAPDIREISGTRVNIRQGPGTIYPVITTLRLGDPVEVLSDSGTGWVRIRMGENRRLGWVSASLVSDRE
ncbi:MAG TPA: ligand-binding protein SH3 [Rhodobacteraceae bacterium]|nr:ligand-binding protein SH3 [Paracoccaceae bacterium]